MQSLQTKKFNYSNFTKETKETLKVLFISNNGFDFNIVKSYTYSSTTHVIDLTYCANEIEAYKYIGAEYYDACIIDFDRLKTQPIEFISNINELQSQTAVIMFENQLNPNSYLVMDRIGADGYLCETGLTPATLEMAILTSIKLKFANIMANETYHAIAFLGHEINTPLCSMLGFSELLTLNNNNKKQSHNSYNDYIYKSGKQIADTIKNIVYLTKVQAGKYKDTPTEINYNELISTIRNRFQHCLNEKNIKLEIDCNEDIPELHIDKQLVTQTVQNITQSAITNSQDGDKIQIGISVDTDSNINISISNVGNAIYAEFQSTNENSKSNFWTNLYKNSYGNGVTLSLASELMNLYDGSVHVQQDEQERTCLTLSFPTDKATLQTG